MHPITFKELVTTLPCIRSNGNRTLFDRMLWIMEKYYHNVETGNRQICHLLIRIKLLVSEGVTLQELQDGRYPGLSKLLMEASPSNLSIAPDDLCSLIPDYEEDPDRLDNYLRVMAFLYGYVTKQNQFLFTFAIISKFSRANICLFNIDTYDDFSGEIFSYVETKYPTCQLCNVLGHTAPNCNLFKHNTQSKIVFNFNQKSPSINGSNDKLNENTIQPHNSKTNTIEIPINQPLLPTEILHKNPPVIRFTNGNPYGNPTLSKHNDNKFWNQNHDPQEYGKTKYFKKSFKKILKTSKFLHKNYKNKLKNNLKKMINATIIWIDGKQNQTKIRSGNIEANSLSAIPQENISSGDMPQMNIKTQMNNFDQTNDQASFEISINSNHNKTMELINSNNHPHSNIGGKNITPKLKVTDSNKLITYDHSKKEQILKIRRNDHTIDKNRQKHSLELSRCLLIKYFKTSSGIPNYCNKSANRNFTQNGSAKRIIRIGIG